MLAGAGLSGSGLAASLAAWKPVLIALSATSLLAANWLVWGRGFGAWPTRVFLVLATIASPLLWFANLHAR